MDISLTGNPKTMTAQAGAAEALPAMKATIDNMKPSEREIEMRKESLKRAAQKEDERRAEEVAAERLRAQLTAGLLPGERSQVKDELDRIVFRAWLRAAHRSGASSVI